MRLTGEGVKSGSETESDGAEEKNQQHLRRASAALSVLNVKWFAPETGLWAGLWWNSACMVSTLSSYALADESAEEGIKTQLSCIYRRASGRGAPDGRGFLNEYYDDEGWWALGWIEAFDFTRDRRYLDTAEEIFGDMKLGATTPCGGIWWDKRHSYIAAIANELYITVAAHLANRVYDDHKKAAYRTLAMKHWNWFSEIGLINAKETINDGLSKKTCENNNGTVFSYNQGVILGALVELSIAANNPTFVETACSIAVAAIKALSDDAGILTEPFSEHPDNDSSQFKGIFVRNLAKLYRQRSDSRFARFLNTNAHSVWELARQKSSGLIGHKWQGPYREATAPTQYSGIECLLAAATVTHADRLADVQGAV